MLSPGWAKSAARKVSWKSSSRTAVPLAQAAHSAAGFRPRPSTVAPPSRGGPGPGPGPRPAGRGRGRPGPRPRRPAPGWRPSRPPRARPGPGRRPPRPAARPAPARAGTARRTPTRLVVAHWLTVPIMLADRDGSAESAFEVLAKARALEAAGVDVVHLEIGEPDAATPAHVAAAQEALDQGLTHYVPAPGPWSCVRPWPRSWSAPAGCAPAPTGWWSPRGQADHVLHHPGPVPGRRRGPLPRPRVPDVRVDRRLRRRPPVPVPLREANRFRMDPGRAGLAGDRPDPAGDPQLAPQPLRQRPHPGRRGGDRRGGDRARPGGAERRGVLGGPLRRRPPERAASTAWPSGRCCWTAGPRPSP